MRDSHAFFEGCILVVGEDNQSVDKLKTIMRSYFSWINNLKGSHMQVDRFPKLIATVPLHQKNSFGSFNIQSIISD